MSIGFGTLNSSKTPSFGAPTSPFGSSSGVSSSPLFGVSSTPASGAFSYPQTNTPMFGSSRPTLFDAPSTSASPLFGAPCTHASKSSLFGAPNTPAPGASDSPLFGEYKTMASGTSNSPLFGSASSTPAFGASNNSPLFGASISPLFGASNKLAFGASRSSLFNTFGTPFEVPNKSVFGASSNPGYAACRSCSNMAYNASNPPFNTTTPFPLQQSSDPASKAFFGSPFGASGRPVTGTPSFDAFTGTTASEFDSSNKPAVSLHTTPFPLQQSSDPASKAFGSPFGASGKPVTGTPSFDAFTGTTASGFDSSNKPAVSLRTTPFPLQQSSDPASKVFFGSPFGASSKPVTGTPSFDAFTGTTASGFDSSNKPAVSLRISPFGGFQTRSFKEVSDPCSCFGKHLSDGFTSWSPFWKDPVRLASFPLAPTKSGCQKEESPAVAYKPLYNYQDENQHVVYMSTSAVLEKDNINMSHDELRWIDYCQRNGKGAESNKSADVFQIKSTSAESDMISIKIEVPSRVAIQLLDVFKSLGIN